MQELLLSLPAEEDLESKLTKVSKASTNEYVDVKKKNHNAPNPTKITGHKKIMIEEHKNFGNVLKNPEFRKSPFDALKSAIKQNMSWDVLGVMYPAVLFDQDFHGIGNRMKGQVSLRQG